MKQDKRFEQFVIGDVLEKIPTSKIPGKAGDFPTSPDAERTLPLLTAGASNQGLTRYAERDRCATVLKDVLSISANGDSGTTFYQSCEFSVLQDAYAARIRGGKEMSEGIGLFLTATMNKAVSGTYGWSLKAGWERVRNDRISLPVLMGDDGAPAKDGSCYWHEEGYVPDWEYMERYITELEQERITELEQYLNATGLNDYELTEEDIAALTAVLQGGGNKGHDREDAAMLHESKQIRWKGFRTGEVFDILSTRCKFHAVNVQVLSDKEDGSLPYVARTSKNNSIKGYLKEDFKKANDGNTISFAQDTAQMSYQPEPYFTGDKIKVLKLRGHEMEEGSALFLVSCLMMAFSEFCWGSSFDSGVISEVEIKLPCTEEDGRYEPDWDLMARFIKAIEKLVIADAVRYKDDMITKLKDMLKE